MLRKYLLLVLVSIQPTFGLARCHCRYDIKPYMLKAVFPEKQKNIPSEESVVKNVEPCPVCHVDETKDIETSGVYSEPSPEKIKQGIVRSAFTRVRNLMEPINSKWTGGVLGVAAAGLLVLGFQARRDKQLAVLDADLQRAEAGAERLRQEIVALQQPPKAVQPVIVPNPSLGQPITVHVQADNHQNLDWLHAELGRVNAQLQELLGIHQRHQEYRADVGAVFVDLSEKINAFLGELRAHGNSQGDIIDALSRNFEQLGVNLERLNRERQELMNKQDAELTRLYEERGRAQAQLEEILKQQPQQSRPSQDQLLHIPLDQQKVSTQSIREAQQIDNALTPFLQEQFQIVGSALTNLQNHLTVLQTQSQSSSQAKEVGSLTKAVTDLQNIVQTTQEREHAFITQENKKLFDALVELQRIGVNEHQRQLSESQLFVKEPQSTVIKPSNDLVHTVEEESQNVGATESSNNTLATQPRNINAQQDEHSSVAENLNEKIQQSQSLDQRSLAPVQETARSSTSGIHQATQTDGLLEQNVTQVRGEFEGVSLENESLKKKLIELESTVASHVEALQAKDNQLAQLPDLQSRLGEAEDRKERLGKLENEKRTIEEEVQRLREANGQLTEQINALQSSVKQQTSSSSSTDIRDLSFEDQIGLIERNVPMGRDDVEEQPKPSMPQIDLEEVERLRREKEQAEVLFKLEQERHLQAQQEASNAQIAREKERRKKANFLAKSIRLQQDVERLQREKDDIAARLTELASRPQVKPRKVNQLGDEIIVQDEQAAKILRKQLAEERGRRKKAEEEALARTVSSQWNKEELEKVFAQFEKERNEKRSLLGQVGDLKDDLQKGVSKNTQETEVLEGRESQDIKQVLAGLKNHLVALQEKPQSSGQSEDMGDLVQFVKRLQSFLEQDAPQMNGALEGVSLENESLKKRLSELESTVASHVEALQAKDNQLAQLPGLQSRLNEAENTLTERNVHLDNLNRLNGLLNNQFKSLLDEKAEAQQKLATAVGEKERKEREFEFLRAEQEAAELARQQEAERLRREEADRLAKEQRELTEAAQKALSHGEVLLQQQGQVIGQVSSAVQELREVRAEQQKAAERAEQSRREEEERLRQEQLQREQAAKEAAELAHQQETERLAQEQIRREEEQRLQREREEQVAREREEAAAQEKMRLDAEEQKRLGEQKAGEVVQQATTQQVLPLLQTLDSTIKSPQAEKLNTLITRVNESFGKFSYSVKDAEAIHHQVNQAIQELMRGRSPQTDFFKQLKNMQTANQQSLNKWKKNYVAGANSKKTPGNANKLVIFIKNYDLKP